MGVAAFDSNIFTRASSHCAVLDIADGSCTSSGCGELAPDTGESPWPPPRESLVLPSLLAFIMLICSAEVAVARRAGRESRS